MRGVHTHLLELDIPLSFLSVREVLKRLCTEGVIVLNADKSYSLHPRAAALLQPRLIEPARRAAQGLTLRRITPLIDHHDHRHADGDVLEQFFTDDAGVLQIRKAKHDSQYHEEIRIEYFKRCD